MRYTPGAVLRRATKALPSKVLADVSVTRGFYPGVGDESFFATDLRRSTRIRLLA
jgi:hypothetical protein